MSSIPNEKIWIIQVQNFFNLEEEDNITRPVSVFNVPKILKAVKPEAYTPQMIALGPYHHWRDGLYEMELYKLIVAKKAYCLFNNGAKIQDIVDMLVKADFKIRAWYHKSLGIDGETLAWMMAIDGLFLLQFLQIYINRSASILASSARMSFLVGKKVAYDSLLKDIMMLENQIPIFVIKRIFRIQFASSSSEVADSLLPSMFLGICKEIAPLELKEDYPHSKVIRCAHLLDLLYQLIVPTLYDQDSQLDNNLIYDKRRDLESNNWNKNEQIYDKTSNMNTSTKVLKELWNKFTAFGIVKRLGSSPPFKLVNAFKPVFSKITSSLGLSNEKNKSVSSSDYSSNDNDEDDDNNNNSKAAHCQVEQIMIPSVTKLAKIGVEFCPTNGDISTIKFDPMNKKFYLPTVHLDVNSEVILRNLVAYEASAISGPLVVARYTELMNGIVDTAEDVRILASQGIIKSELGYEEVANLWNGMHKSIRLSCIDFMDEAIEGVNIYYHSTTKVQIYMRAKSYVYGSWRMLVLLASLLVIALMCLQSFCSVYNCPRVFNLEQ